MRRYTVSCDVVIPLVMEIEADSEDAALDKLWNLTPRALLDRANIESAEILEGSESTEEVMS